MPLGLTPFLFNQARFLCFIARASLLVSLVENKSPLAPLRDHTLSESKALDFLDSAISLLALDSIILLQELRSCISGFVVEAPTAILPKPKIALQ